MSVNNCVCFVCVLLFRSDTNLEVAEVVIPARDSIVEDTADLEDRYAYFS